MPTGARLISGIYFGVLAYIASQIVHTNMEAEIGYDLQLGIFKEINALIGVLTGWIVMGSRAHEGKNFAIQGGILTGVLIIFWCTILWSIVEMVKESMKLKYPNASRAVIDAFRIAIEYLQSLIVMNFILTMVIGAIIGGLLAVWAARRYR